MRNELKATRSETQTLEYAIAKYVNSWFDGLVKSWKTDANKQALRHSYDFVAKQAVEAYIENQKSKLENQIK